MFTLRGFEIFERRDFRNFIVIIGPILEAFSVLFSREFTRGRLVEKISGQG